MMRFIRTFVAPCVAAVGLASGGAAQAQMFGLGQFAPDQWYVKGFGGATFGRSDRVNFRGDGELGGERINLRYDTGYTLGASVGAYFTPTLAMELEYAYRAMDTSGQASGNAWANSFMLNGIFDVGPMMQTQWPVSPYVGAGIGMANVDVRVAGDSTYRRDTALAYQFIGGVGFEVAPNVDLFGEARWFGTDNGQFSGGGNRRFNGQFETIDLLVGARFAF